MRRRRTKNLMHGLLGKAEVTCLPAVPPGKTVQVCVRKPEKPGPQITGPDDVCRLLKGAKNSDRESFYAIHLDTQNKIIGVEEVSRGTLNETMTSGRELFKAAVANNSAALIIAHNHPSGNSNPSNADIQVTRTMAKAGQILGIPIRDHVVVASEGCTSLREQFGTSIEFGRAKLPRRRRGRR